MEFLKEHLTPELYTQLEEALKDKGEVVKIANLASGDYVRKDKHEGELGRSDTKVKDLTIEVKTLQGELEKVKSSTGDIETVKAEALKAEEASKGRLTDIQTDYDKSSLDYEIRLAVLASGAKDEKSVIAHLDREKISLVDGKISGLNDQLTPMKESHKYLFGEPKKILKSDPPNPPPPDGNLDVNAWSAKHEKELKAGNTREAIKIKQAAAAEGVILN